MSTAALGLLCLSGVERRRAATGPAVLPGGVLATLGAGSSMVPATIVAVRGVPPQESGLASGVLNTSRLAGGTLGLAVLTTIATSQHHSELLGGGTASGVAFTDGYQVAFQLGAGRLPASARSPPPPCCAAGTSAPQASRNRPEPTRPPISSLSGERADASPDGCGVGSLRGPEPATDPALHRRHRPRRESRTGASPSACARPSATAVEEIERPAGGRGAARGDRLVPRARLGRPRLDPLLRPHRERRGHAGALRPRLLRAARRAASPTDFAAKADFTDVLAEDNPDWQIDLNDDVIGRWRGENGRAGAVTLVWGRPLVRGAVAATAELDGETVDQEAISRDRFTLIALDALEGYGDERLHAGQALEPARPGAGLREPLRGLSAARAGARTERDPGRPR